MLTKEKIIEFFAWVWQLLIKHKEKAVVSLVSVLFSAFIYYHNVVINEQGKNIENLKHDNEKEFIRWQSHIEELQDSYKNTIRSMVHAVDGSTNDRIEKEILVLKELRSVVVQLPMVSLYYSYTKNPNDTYYDDSCVNKITKRKKDECLCDLRRWSLTKQFSNIGFYVASPDILVEVARLQYSIENIKDYVYTPCEISECLKDSSSVKTFILGLYGFHQIKFYDHTTVLFEDSLRKGLNLLRSIDVVIRSLSSDIKGGKQ